MSIFKVAAKKVLGSQHVREAKKFQPLVDKINLLCKDYQALSDGELKAKTDDFKDRIKAATEVVEADIESLRDEKRNCEDPKRRQELQDELSDLDVKMIEIATDFLEGILPEAFATVKEACRRLLGTEIIVTGQKLTWDMVPYDVQIIGAVALQQGLDIITLFLHQNMFF